MGSGALHVPEHLDGDARAGGRRAHAGARVAPDHGHARVAAPHCREHVAHEVLDRVDVGAVVHAAEEEQGRLAREALAWLQRLAVDAVRDEVDAARRDRGEMSALRRRHRDRPGDAGDDVALQPPDRPALQPGGDAARPAGERGRSRGHPPRLDVVRVEQGAPVELLGEVRRHVELAEHDRRLRSARDPAPEGRGGGRVVEERRLERPAEHDVRGELGAAA